MPASNGGRSRKQNRASRNNNPEGTNQYSGIVGTARSSPLAAAAAVGGAIVAGAFLWSKRGEISDAIGDVSDHIRGRPKGPAAREQFATAEAASPAEIVRPPEAPFPGQDRSQTEIAEEALTLKEIGQRV